MWLKLFKHFKDFSKLLDIFLFQLCIILIPMISCIKQDQKKVTESEKPPFMIDNLGVRFAPWNPATNEAGDFLFKDISNLIKIVTEFGMEVVAYDGSLKRLPTMDFIIRENAPIFAIAEGEVSRVFYQKESDDYEIGIRSLNDPDYEIGYDHLVNLQVEMNEIITPGDTIGYPRPLFLGLGSFEIMVNNGETGLSYCPFCCFNPDKIEEYQNKLNQLIQDWETFKKDTTIYDESDFVFPGCLMESMESY